MLKLVVVVPPALSRQVQAKCSEQKTDAKKLDLAGDRQTDGQTNIKENHLGLQFLPFSL